MPSLAFSPMDTRRQTRCEGSPSRRPTGGGACAAAAAQDAFSIDAAGLTYSL